MPACRAPGLQLRAWAVVPLRAELRQRDPADHLAALAVGDGLGDHYPSERSRPAARQRVLQRRRLRPGGTSRAVVLVIGEQRVGHDRDRRPAGKRGEQRRRPAGWQRPCPGPGGQCQDRLSRAVGAGGHARPGGDHPHRAPGAVADPPERYRRAALAGGRQRLRPLRCSAVGPAAGREIRGRPVTAGNLGDVPGGQAVQRLPYRTAHRGAPFPCRQRFPPGSCSPEGTGRRTPFATFCALSVTMTVISCHHQPGGLTGRGPAR